MSHLYTLCRAALRKTAGPSFELLIVKVTERLKLAAMLQCLQETVISRMREIVLNASFVPAFLAVDLIAVASRTCAKHESLGFN